MPRFEYLLDDLTAEREAALRARPGPPLAQLAWLVLRYGRPPSISPAIAYALRPTGGCASRP